MGRIPNWEFISDEGGDMLYTSRFLERYMSDMASGTDVFVRIVRLNPDVWAVILLITYGSKKGDPQTEKVLFSSSNKQQAVKWAREFMRRRPRLEGIFDFSTLNLVSRKTYRNAINNRLMNKARPLNVRRLEQK